MWREAKLLSENLHTYIKQMDEILRSSLINEVLAVEHLRLTLLTIMDLA